MASEFVSTILSSGLDSFTNLYDLSITVPTQVITFASGNINGMDISQVSNLLKLRIGDFNAPQPKLAQYNQDYKTVQLVRVAPMMEFERKFDINFRMDTNYYAFHTLKQWSYLYHDVLEGGINLPSGTEEDILGKIVVEAYAPNTGETSILWTYDKVICNKVTDPNYSRAGTEPVTVTASFMFFDYLPDTGSEVQLQGTLSE